MESNELLNMSQTDESDMDKMFKYIFAACDTESKDRVLVSRLIEFIKPYMKDNFGDTESLKESLDPINTDPEVSVDTFVSIMSLWAKKFNQEDSFHNISPNDIVEVPLVESTPRRSFGNRQQRVYAEAAALDISVVDSHSVCNDCAAEKLVYEDRIQELVHHNKRFQDELAIVKAQLSVQEDQNECLQVEFDKLTKQLRYERGLNETLIKETQEFEEIRDNSLHKEKQIDKMQKQIAQFERENILLEDKLNNAENYRREMDEKLQHMHAKLTEARNDVQGLQAEIIAKEAQIVKVKEENGLLVRKVSDQDQLIDQINERNDYLTVCKEKVTKIFQESMRRHSHGGPLMSMNKSHMNKSLPNMYIVERSNERKPLTDAYSSYEGTTGDEDLLGYQVETEFADGYQLSLQDELSTLPNGVQPPALSSAPCKDCDEMRDRIRELIEEVDLHKENIARLNSCQKKIEELQISKQGLEYKIEEYLNELTELRREAEHYGVLRDNLRAMQKDYVGMKAILHKHEREAMKQERNTSMWAKQLDQVENLNTNLKERITYLLDENQALKQIEYGLKQNIATLTVEKQEIMEMNNLRIKEIKENVEHVRSTLSKSSEECSSLCVSNKELVNINKTLSTNLADQIARFTEFKKEHERYVAIIDSASDESVSTFQKLELIANAVQQCNSLRLCNEELMNINETLNSNLDDEIARFTEFRKEHERFIAVIDSTSNESISTFQKLELIGKAVQQCNSLRSSNEDLMAENASLSSKLQNEIERFIELKKEFERYVAVIDSTSNECLSTFQKLEVVVKAVQQCNSLRSSNEELMVENSTLKSQLQNDIAHFTKVKEEHDRYVTIIDSSSKECLTTFQKLELLITMVQAYEDIKEKNHALVEECNKLRATPKKTQSHERSQIQLSKIRERNEYLDEMLKTERSKLATLEEQLQQERCSKETLRNEIMNLLVRVDVLNKFEISALALDVDINKLSNSFNKLKFTVCRLSEEWAYIFNQVSSLKLPFESLSDSALQISDQSSIIKVQQMNNEVETITQILGGLINVKFELRFNDNEPAEVSTNLKTILEESESDDAKMTNSFDLDTLSSYSDEIDPFDDLHNIYLPENLEGLLRNVRMNDFSPLKAETFQIEEFALTFMVENNSIKKRLRDKFNELQDVTSQMANQFRAFVLMEKDCRKEGRLMNISHVIVKKINLLSKLAEQFGGLQMEIKHSRILNILLSHIAHLNQQFDSPESTSPRCIKPHLSGKLVYCEGSRCLFNCQHNIPRSIPCSSSCFQAAFHKLRSFGFLVIGVLAFVIIAFIIIKEFFMSDEDGQANLPVCWISWYDNAVSLAQRKYTSGTPPT